MVKASLVKDSQYTGKERLVKFVAGSKCQCSEAQIEVETVLYRASFHKCDGQSFVWIDLR